MFNQSRLIDTFLDLIKIPSPSGKERACADYIKNYLTTININCIEDSAGEKINGDTGNIIIHLPSPALPKILFSAHMDTVGPCEKIVPIIEGDLIKTDGTSVLGGDDKSGVAVLLEVLHTLSEQKIPHPDLTIIFSISEETGLLGAKNVDPKYLQDIDYGIVLDGSGEIGTIYNSAPYSAKGFVTVYGKAAHSGLNPEDGIHALVVAAHVIERLTIGRVSDTSSCNIGLVNGGVANNVIMPEVELSFEVRALYPQDLEQIISTINKQFQESCSVFGATCSSTIALGTPEKPGTPGFLIDPQEPIIQLFKKSTLDKGFPFSILDGKGGSDANIYNEQGIPTLNVSVGMSNIHSTDEYILKSNLSKATELVLAFIQDLTQK